MNILKKLPYSDLVFKSIEWCHWFVLFNVFISILIGIRYILNSNFHHTTLSLVYEIANLFGQFWFINFFVFLVILFPLAFIITSNRYYRIATTIVLVFLQTFLLIDTQFFYYFKFHLNVQLFNIFTDNYGKGTNFNFLYAFIPLLIIVEIFFYKYARYKQEKHRTNWIAKIFISLFLFSFASTHLLHAWADSTDYQPILVQESILPLSYPMTAKSFLAKHDWLMFSVKDTKSQTYDSLKYPLTPIVTNNNYNNYNYLIISIKNWNYDFLTDENMSFVNSLANKSISFNQYYSPSMISNNALIPFFYGIESQYANSIEHDGISPILLDELQRQEYLINVYISNSTITPDITDTGTFKGLRKNGYIKTTSDLNTTEKVINYLTNFNDDEKQFFTYVSLEQTSLVNKLKNKIAISDTFYRNSLVKTDSLIHRIIDKLDNNPHINNRTIIIILGEYGFDFENLNELPTFANLHVPLFIYKKDVAPTTIETMSSHIDFAPTILSNYLGVTNHISDYSNGSNLFDNINNKEKYIVGGDANNIYVIQSNSITMIDRKGNFTNSDSKNVEQEQIKMPVLLKVMRQLNKFYNK